MKKILLLGATGFIGKNVLLNLIKTYPKSKIICIHFKSKPWINNKNVFWIKGDLRNPNFCNKITKNIDLLIQAAATTSGSKDIVNSPSLHVTDNAIMNSYLTKYAHENFVKHFIFFSCTVMYHNSSKSLKEIDYNPKRKIYKKYFGVANTKIYIEKICQFYSEMNRVKFSVIRHSNIFGPYDKFDLEKSHFFGATVNKVINAKKEIVIWGNGSEKRDLLFVDDLIDFINKVITNQKKNFSIYNCGYGKSFRVIDIVKKIIEASGKKLIIKKDINKPTIKTKLSLDCSKAKKELNWKRKIHINDAIKKTINWYIKNNELL
jgi:GDP-L-fucose synthase